MLTGNYNFATRSVAVPFVYDSYGFTMHVNFTKETLFIYCIVNVTGQKCHSAILPRDYSGNELAV